MKEKPNYRITELGEKLNALGEKYAESISEKTPGDFFKKYDEKEETYHLIDRRTKHQKELANEIIENSDKLIYSIILRLFNSGFEMPNGKRLRVSKRKYSSLEDFFDEGAAIVIERLHNYNPSKGRMTSFISCNVAERIYRISINYDSLIHLTPYTYVKAKKIIHKSKSKNEAINNISSKIQWKEKNLSLQAASTIFLGCTNHRESIDDELGEWCPGYIKESSLGENQKYGRIEEVENEIYKKELKPMVKRLLNDLNPREKTIVKMRFGIGYNREYTLEELGQKFNVSRERIRQLEKESLKKLRETVEEYVPEGIQ